MIAATRARLGVDLLQWGVYGFAVCPPRGEDLKQEALDEALSGLLALDLPLALYQLAQVTQNEMSPELVQDLARHHANL